MDQSPQQIEATLRDAFARVQEILGTQYDLSFAQDPENREKDDSTMLSLARSARGKDDPLAFNVWYTDHLAELNPTTDALHEILHCISYQLYDDGCRRLRAAEIVELLKVWERQTYSMERAITPLVLFWELPWWRRVLGALRRSPR